MKRKIMPIGLLALAILIFSFAFQTKTDLKPGDIVFQDSYSRQSQAIKLATHSQFSHVGIVFKKDGKLQVLEGVQPVKYTPLDQWIRHGKNNSYEVKRLKGRTLSSTELAKMQRYGEQLLNKNYDIFFNWSNEEIYCSELVWKIYKEGAGIELCPTKKLKSFDLDHAIVKTIMKERYGNNVPYEEPVVAPSDLYESTFLVSGF